MYIFFAVTLNDKSVAETETGEVVDGNSELARWCAALHTNGEKINPCGTISLKTLLNKP